MNQIIIYQTSDNQTQIDVKFEHETVWLTQKQMAMLFDKNVMTVSEHIKNIYSEGELDDKATIRKSLIVQQEGNREVNRKEALIAKNYLQVDELKVLNNLVSAYFDLAEINAIEQKPMTMADYINELDRILNSAGRKLLEGAGKVNHNQAEEKAKTEFRTY